MRKLALIAMLCLAACSPSVSGTDQGGVAQWYGASPAPAIEAADQHCKMYGRTARVNGVQPQTGYVLFSCEKPGS